MIRWLIATPLVLTAVAGGAHAADAPPATPAGQCRSLGFPQDSDDFGRCLAILLDDRPSSTDLDKSQRLLTLSMARLEESSKQIDVFLKENDAPAAAK